MRTLLVIFVIVLGGALHAQDRRIADSLKVLLGKETNDSLRIKFLCEIAYNLQNTDLPKMLEHIKMAEELATETENKLGLSEVYERYGNYFENKGDYKKAIDYYNKCLKLRESISQVPMASVMHNLGTAYYYIAAYDKALEFLIKAATENEKRGNLKGLSQNYNNIGLVYQMMGNFDKAGETYWLAYETAKKSNNKVNTAYALANYAIVMYQKKDFDQFLKYNNEAYRIFEEVGDKQQVANCLNNSGAVSLELKRYDEALDFFQKSLKAFRMLGDPKGISASLNNVGDAYMNLGKYDLALVYLDSSLTLAQEIGSVREQELTIGSLVGLFEKKGDYKKAFDYRGKLMAVRDSNMNVTTKKQINELAAKYESDKKQIEIESLKKDNALRDSEIAKKNLLNWMLIGGALLILMLAGFIAFRYTEKQKANKLLMDQKEIIELKNKDITDSIQYAKRIQDAMQPSRDLLARLFPEHFLLSMPRDIVSGDFYWFMQDDERIFLAAADCTGHGVPGALMSMVGLNMLGQIVREQHIYAPDKILGELHRRVVISLNTNIEKRSSMDGMDIGLLVVNKKNRTALFSGAVRPLVTVKHGFLEVYKGDRYSIGGIKDMDTPFTLHELQLTPGSNVYLFSDGYADQFGGPDRKKFMLKKFHDLLTQVSGKPMQEQEKDIRETYLSWKGGNEQVDDVLVIGLRIPEINIALSNA